jgi:hypothetical protein
MLPFRSPATHYSIQAHVFFLHSLPSIYFPVKTANLYFALLRNRDPFMERWIYFRLMDSIQTPVVWACCRSCRTALKAAARWSRTTAKSGSTGVAQRPNRGPLACGPRRANRRPQPPRSMRWTRSSNFQRHVLT